jgi:hypothetical protein
LLKEVIRYSKGNLIQKFPDKDGAHAMKTNYRIYIIGDVPHDMKDRIAAIHAAGIINGNKQKVSVYTQTKKDQNKGWDVGSNPSSLRGN